ncbi:MAG TPA: hypothetical protein ENJ80_11580 [Gammaproteobacteria bacterium]|nr:hypothetical protein [Gammaproteobacteria bacterium]
MNRQGLVLAVLLATGLVACSSEDDVTEKADRTGGAEHPWSSQVEALDKAKNVEKDVMDAYQRQAQEIDQQSQ